MAFPEASKPEIGIRENHQLTTVKRNILGPLDLYEGEFRKGGGVLNTKRPTHSYPKYMELQNCSRIFKILKIVCTVYFITEIFVYITNFDFSFHGITEIAQHFVFEPTCYVIDEAEVNETWFPRPIFLKFLTPLKVM